MTVKVISVHTILGAVDYTKIKSQEKTRIGQHREPTAYLTNLQPFTKYLRLTLVFM